MTHAHAQHASAKKPSAPAHSLSLSTSSHAPARAGGELFTRIASAPAQRFGEAQARFFFVQMVSGIGYVHSQAMAHRDLKLENALLMDDTPRPRLAICDFGCARHARGRAGAPCAPIRASSAAKDASR